LSYQVVEIEAVALAQAPVVLVVDFGEPLSEKRSGARLVLAGREERVFRLADLIECRAGADLALVVIEVL